MAESAGWRALLNRLLSTGKTVFDTSTVLEDPKGTKDPKVWALALLARTIGSVEGAVVLLDSGHVVEARTLVRCCYENFFCAAALVKTGDAFIKTMELDDAASRKKQAKGLLDWVGRQDQQLDFTEKLMLFADAMEKQHPKASYLNHKKTAEAGTIADGCIFYNVLSNDAAHPSATSLSRHITWEGEGDDAEWTISAFPTDDPSEFDETLELACSVLLGVTVAVNEAVGGTETGERLFALSDEFRALSTVNKAARDNKAA
jgi:flagellar hook-associated protein FlgK